MGANKNIDDITLKTRDDITLKVTDDGTVKFRDDIATLKFADDHPTIKAIDDPKLKVVDDPKLKVVDDPKLKIVDDPQTLKGVEDKNKAFDDTKLPGYDKSFTDGFDPGNWYDPRVNPAIRSAQPFILSTPHHSTEWQQSLGQAAPADPNDPAVQSAQFESYLAQLSDARNALQEQLKQLEEHYNATQKEFEELKAKQKKSDKK